MRSVESVDEDDLLALGGMGGMNNGVMALRKSTASMSSAMSVSSDQMSTGGPPLLLTNIYPHPPADIVLLITHTLTLSLVVPLHPPLIIHPLAHTIYHLSHLLFQFSLISTGGDLGNESTVEESDGAMSEGGGGSTTPESNGHHGHGAHQLISSSMNRGGGASGLMNNKATMVKHELEQQEDSDEVGLMDGCQWGGVIVFLAIYLFDCLFVKPFPLSHLLTTISYLFLILQVYLDQSTSDEDGDGPLNNNHHTTSGGIMINKLNKLGLGMVEEGVEPLDPLRGARASSAGEGGGMTLRHARRRRKVQSAGEFFCD